MLSDWQIGSGVGRGDIDRIVQKDNHDLAYIPAKTLTGIIRDGCELVAQGLDHNEENGNWQQWVNYLFGDQPALAKPETIKEEFPQSAALVIRPAYFPERLQLALISRPKVKQALTFIKPGITIDADTGCAKVDNLRFEELVRKGSILEAKECTLNLPENLNEIQKNAAYALLIAGVKIVERLGGKRRRGSGLCKIEIESNPQPWLEWLQKQKSAPAIPISNSLESISFETSSNNYESVWETIPLTVKTLTPVVIGKRTVGNVVESLDYIPGSHFLRIIHKKLGNWINIGQAISNSDIIITNATVAIDNKAGIPTPFCLFADKVKGGLDKGYVYNRFSESESHPTDKNIQLKGIRGGYIGNFDNQELPLSQKVNVSLYTHNTIEDDVQRPTEDIGGVYSYQAIPAEVELKAELRIKKALVDQLNRKQKQWREVFTGKYQIGRSKKDDYGLIKLSTSSPREIPQALINQEKPNILTLWLVSDLLLRDERLKPTTDLEELRKYLVKALNIELKEIDSIARQRRVDSWQVRWGLPRPSLVGLQAGSCIKYEIINNPLTTEILLKELTRIQAEGIGERRTEGYGQVYFNHPLLSSNTSKLKIKTSDDTPHSPKKDNFRPLSKDKTVYVYAQTLEKEAWRQEIRSKILELASQETQRQHLLGIEVSKTSQDTFESKPTITQLGILRSVLRKLTTPQSTPTWLTSLESKEKWPQESLEKIKQLVGDGNQIWRILNISDDLTITKNAPERLKDELWAEAVKTLIDECIRAHKRYLEEVQYG